MELVRHSFTWDTEEKDSILAWLAAYQAPEQFYFADKEGEYELAGLGSALDLRGQAPGQVSSALSQLWAQHPDATVFGGTSFSAQEPVHGEWAAFGDIRFTLPLVEVRRTGGNVRMAFNCINGQNLSMAPLHLAMAGLLEDLENLRKSTPACQDLVICRDERIPARQKWDWMISRALKEIHEGDIDKVVLSRKKVLTASCPWDALDIVDKLADIQDDSFVFLYKIAQDTAFLGRTPERLLRLKGRSLSVDAIAGTRPRGQDTMTDKLLENELLGSPKELEEHRIVSRYVEGHMDKIARDTHVGARERVLKLKNVQHIFTQHFGTMQNGQGVLDTVRCFHPTPAVGGHPSQKALELIQECEPHQRGWYAAPIGWMNGHGADFAVGIRSALVHGKELHVFAGAGIVDKSDADSEWRETEHKMQTIARVSGDC